MTSTDAIQAIFIKTTETRVDEKDKKPYTAYRIDIQAVVRQWHVWKRYSDFTRLHDQLTAVFPHNKLPAHLPHKRIFPPTFAAPGKVEDRRQGLEDYLRAIQVSKNDRWRKTDIWTDFLALPLTQVSEKVAVFTSGSWLDECDDLTTLSREIRSLINNRNTFTGQQEVSEAMRCDVRAKKDLATLTARLGILESSLEHHDLVEGEQRRRQDKLVALKMERDLLVQLVNIRQELNHQPRKQLTTTAAVSNFGNHYGDIGFSNHQQPTRAATTNVTTPRQGRRAFGNQLRQIQETEQTKGLDNRELLNYQTEVMKDQDIHIEQFSQLLNRQKEIGVAISHELENHIDTLESLDAQVDKTSSKLAFANKKLNKIK